MAANLLLTNGQLLTMNPEQPTAQAVGIREGRIVAVGSHAEVVDVVGRGVEQIDLQGRTATPGLNDAHAHPMNLGFAKLDLNISSPPVKSITEMVQLVKEAAGVSRSGGWIQGRGYDQARLEEQRHPTRYDLDPVSSGNPVILFRACHHIGVANSLALQLAGIDRNTPDPDGGTIDRDEHGEPTGVLRETAFEMVREAIGQPSQSEIEQAIRRGGEALWAAGVTSAAEAVVDRPETLAAYQALRDQGELPHRVYMMMIIDQTLDALIDLGIKTGFGDEQVRIGPAKLFSDGSIGGHTARMSQPYEGTSDNYGLWMEPPEVMKEKVLKAHRAGFQLGIHAIGDAAINLILDAYDEAQADSPRPDARHRIEHCSIIDERILGRLKSSGVIPIPGTSFLYYFRDAYVQNLGYDRIRYAYGMKSFIDNGIIAAASTDTPIVSERATIGLQTMMTRLDQAGQECWTEESIGLQDALRAYSWNGAYASFEEGIKGSLEPGKLGDVTVFQTDLESVPGNEIGQVQIDFTIKDGAVVYARQ